MTVSAYRWQASCLLVGLLLGASGRLAQSRDAVPPAPNPNVVVLRGVKRVTLNEDAQSISQAAGAMARQTGVKLTLDKRYADDKTRYAFRLKDVPLVNVLDVIACLSGGTWDRSGRSYHLRPRTEADGALDAARMEAALWRAYDYLSDVNPKDIRDYPHLPASDLGGFRMWMDKIGTQFAPPESVAYWKVSGKGGLSLSYGYRGADGKDYTGGMAW